MTTETLQRPARETMPVKLDKHLVELAQPEANLFGRSVGRQIEYWAELGRVVDAMPGFTLDRCRAALKGDFAVDDLSAEERVYLDDMLSDLFKNPTEATKKTFVELGKNGVGDDPDGQLVRTTNGVKTVIKE